MFGFNKTIIVTGHYGSGKTNLSLNMALHLRGLGHVVALADLDVVNPYFRSADFKLAARENGIDLLASDYANSTLDIPALTGGLEGRLSGSGYLIIDVGGDDAGAFALGRFAQRIIERPYTMLYVVNAYRYLMKEPAEAAFLLEQIETASRLTATHIVNNSSLGAETTAEDIINSQPYALEVARLTKRPLVFTSADRRHEPELIKQIPNLFPIDIHVKTPWS